jgi:hypothetical protein
MFVIDNLHKVGQFVDSLYFDCKWGSALTGSNVLDGVGYVSFG